MKIFLIEEQIGILEIIKFGKATGEHIPTYMYMKTLLKKLKAVDYRYFIYLYYKIFYKVKQIFIKPSKQKDRYIY